MPEQNSGIDFASIREWVTFIAAMLSFILLGLLPSFVQWIEKKIERKIEAVRKDANADLSTTLKPIEKELSSMRENALRTEEVIRKEMHDSDNAIREALNIHQQRSSDQRLETSERIKEVEMTAKFHGDRLKSIEDKIDDLAAMIGGLKDTVLQALKNMK